jgi:hypothetical protein
MTQEYLQVRERERGGGEREREEFIDNRQGREL